jgi:hypothetical protein
MNNRSHWLAASLGGVLVGAFLLIGGAWAQEPPVYGGPYISNPAPPEVSERQVRIHEAYCRKQFGGICPPSDKTFTQEQLKEQEEDSRYRGPYVPPDPANTAPAVVTSCSPDPDNPEGPRICTECRTHPADPGHPLCVRQIPGQSVDIPQLPASASRTP